MDMDKFRGYLNIRIIAKMINAPVREVRRERGSNEKIDKREIRYGAYR